MPLAEVLVKIHRYRAPGRVDCRRGDEVKRIYLDHGQIIFATTNQLAESLGDKLLREGRITRRAVRGERRARTTRPASATARRSWR